MALGGAFSVSKKEILSVNCFDLRFKGYGFTETSAVTKLIAEKNNYLIPCLDDGCLHIEDPKVNISKDKKDEIFKEKHNFYFNVFLAERIK